MKKLIVLAMVVMLSASLIWAADSLKSTKHEAARSAVLSKAEVAKVTHQVTSKSHKLIDRRGTLGQSDAVAPAPVKETEQADVIAGNNGIAANATLKPAQSGKMSLPGFETAPQASDTKAGYLGESIDKDAAQKQVDLDASPVIPVISGNTNPGNEIPIIERANFWGPINANGWGPYGNNPPAGWTIQDQGTMAYAWNNNDWYKFYYSSWLDTVARVNYFPNENNDDWFISPAVNFTSAVVCSLAYNLFYDDYSASDTFWVKGSADGVNWTDIITYYAADFGSSTESASHQVFDITAFAAGDAAYKVAFMFRGPGATNAYLDKVELWADATNLFSCDMNNWLDANRPIGPCGSTIEDHQFQNWDSNDWSKFYYSSWADTVFDVYFNPRENLDEWLISPALNFSAGYDTLELSFYRFYDDITGDYDTAWVYGSTDGGATWPVTIVTYVGADAGSSVKATSQVVYDIKPWADLQSNVKFAWRYKNASATSGGGAMYLDDIAVKVESYWDDIAATGLGFGNPFLQTGVPNNVNCSFSNAGIDTLPQIFDGRLVINNGTSDVYDQTVTGISLTAGTSITVAFPSFTPAANVTHTFTLTAVNTGEENPGDNTYSSSGMVYLHQGAGALDGGFYNYIDNTQIGGPTFGWVDMTGASNYTFSSADDGYTPPAYMGGSFFFYGAMYDSLSAGSNGHLSFLRLTASYRDNVAIPSSGLPNAILAFAWDDMLLTSTTGAIYLNDVANNRFVVEYPNIQFYSSTPSTDTFDVQIILDRDDSTIVFQYKDFGTSLQTDMHIGIENASGTIGQQYFGETNFGNYLFSGLAIKYYYTAPAADVGIASFDAPNGTLFMGTPYTMMATAQNFTENSATFDVEFYADAALIGTVNGVTLAGFATQQVSCPSTWTPLTTGDHSLQARTVYAGDLGPANDQITVTRVALGAPLAPDFTLDFEASNGSFVPTNEWEWGIPTYASGPTSAHSGANLWGTDLDNTYDPAVLNSLYFVPINLSAATAPNMRFWLWHSTESGYDGGNLNISTDNGATWSVITTSLPYDATGYYGAPGIGGEPVWHGSRSWTEVLVGLAPYIGQTVLFRLDQSSDGSVQYAGFYIDDVSVIEPPQDDVGVNAILAPGSTTIQGFSWLVQSRVHNFGAATKLNVPVNFDIYDIANNLVYTQSYTLSRIEAGVDSVVTFTAWAPAEPDTHRFVSYTTLPGDVTPANDTSRATTYTYSHVGNGGPVEYWSFADNVNGGGPAFNWIDITTVGDSIPYADRDDGNSGFIAMPFAFNFFGAPYNQININTNGWLSFTTSTGSYYNNASIPSTGLPNALIGLLWDDLHMGTPGKIFHYYDAVENQFIIEYYQVEYYSSGGPDRLTFEIIFDGDDNSIKMQYLEFVGGSQTDVTVGIENADGTVGLAYDNNGQIGQTPLPGVAITWTYNPPPGPAVDAAVGAVIPSVPAVMPGGLVDISVQLTNNGYEATVASLQTIAVGSTSGECYNNITGGIAIGPFETVTVNLPQFQTPSCSESLTVTSTVSAPGDGNPGNDTGAADLVTQTAYNANIPEANYYWPYAGFTFAREIHKPAQGVITHAAVFYQDIAVPRYNFDLVILADTGAPGAALYGPVTVQNNYPNLTYIDISTAYPTLPDSFFFGVVDLYGNSTTFTGILSDNGSSGDPGWYFDGAIWGQLGYGWCIGARIDLREGDFYDVAPASIDAPGTTVIGAGPFPVAATVANVGNVATTDAWARMVITGPGGDEYDQAVTGLVINPMDNALVTFPDWTPSQAGVTYTLNLSVGVGNEGDVCNNVASGVSLVIGGSRPVFYDFEANNGGFTPSTVWQWGAPTYVDGPAAFSGVNCWGTVLAGPYPSDACDSLMTAAYTVPAGGGAMVFYLWYDNEQGWDGFHIEMSVNGGPYDVVTPVGGYDDIEGGYLCDLGLNKPYFTGFSGGWVPKAVELSAYVGQNVAFKFAFASDGSVQYAGTYIDDFTIYSYAGPEPQEALAQSGNFDAIAVSNFGRLGDYDALGYTYNWNNTTPINYGGTFILGNSGATMMLDYGTGLNNNPFHQTDYLDMTDLFHPTARFDDNGLLGGVTVDYNGYGFTAGDTADIFIHEYIITNNSGVAVNGLYAGNYFDWDIGATDVVTFDRTNNVIIQGPTAGPFYGVELVSGDVNTLFGVSQFDFIYDQVGWDADTLYAYIGVNADIMPFTYADMGSLASYGPFDLAPGASDTVAFAVIGGASRANVSARAVLAHDVYQPPAAPTCQYVPGDVNNSGVFNGIDVTFMVGYFKGGPVPPYSCECTPGNTWYVAGDVNGNCVFNGIDVTYSVSYFKGGAAPRPCPDCPPGVLAAPALITPGLKANPVSSGNNQ